MEMTKKKFIKALNILWDNDSSIAKSISEQMLLFDEYASNPTNAMTYLLIVSAKYFIQNNKKDSDLQLPDDLHAALGVCDKYSQLLFEASMEYTFNPDIKKNIDEMTNKLSKKGETLC